MKIVLLAYIGFLAVVCWLFTVRYFKRRGQEHRSDNIAQFPGCTVRKVQRKY